MKALALLLVAVAASLPAASGRAASAPCQPVTIVGQTEATSPAGPFVGTGTVTVGDTTFEDVPIVTTVLAPLGPAGGSGVAFTSTSHSLALPGGTITTLDEARLIPTQDPGVFRLVTNQTIVAGGSGHLHLQGTVDFSVFPFVARAQITGAVCGR